MDYFSKLPNSLFIGTKEEEESILKKIKNDKVVFILDYLYTNTNRRGESVFTLEDIVSFSGYKPNRNKGKINEQYKDMLLRLQELSIISFNIDTNTKAMTFNQYMRCSLNLDLSKNFMILYEWEKEKVLNQNVAKVDSLKLLIYYCYLKTRMFKRAKGQELYKDTPKGETCKPSYKIIMEDLEMASETVCKYNQALHDLDLIRYKNFGKWYYASDKLQTLKETPNFYTLCKEGWESEINGSIKYYKQQNADSMIFTNKDYKSNDKKANGYIGRIEFLEKEGKATKEQIDKKQELIEKRDSISNYIKSNNRLFTLQGLFDTNEGKLLSEIYRSKGQTKNSEEEYGIERDLGLINDKGVLLTDYKYYMWVMENYKPEEQKYFFNCVKKHKGVVEVKHKGLVGI